MSITCSDGHFTSEAAYHAFLKKKAQAQAAADAKAQAEGRNTIRSRNATTHGLFARDVVLPHLGEDPAGYDALFQAFSAQIKPADLLERHYTEKIAAASWRLRRLHRWQAQLFEDDTLTEDERLDKLDRVLRHETALHRQIDTAVKMLAREVPRLFESRARETALSLVQATERDCARSPDTDWDVARTAREKRAFAPLPDDFPFAALDNAPAPDTQSCQNEPAPPLATPPLYGHGVPCPSSAPVPSAPRPSDPTPPELGAGGRSSESRAGGRSSESRAGGRSSESRAGGRSSESRAGGRSSERSAGEGQGGEAVQQHKKCKNEPAPAPLSILPFREDPAKQGGGFTP